MAISVWERWKRKLIRRKSAAIRRVKAWMGSIEPYWPPAAMIAILVVALILLRPHYNGWSSVDQGVYIEGWGTVIDLSLVGLLLTWFTLRRDKKDSIRRYIEEIDDFKRWDSDESRVRIAGNIRRLAKLGKCDLDLSGITLRDFSFFNHNILNIAGSDFHANTWDTIGRTTTLESVSFMMVNCTDVVFSRSLFGGTGMGLEATNLQFDSATLVNACFDGARLSWTGNVADQRDWYELVNEGEESEGHLQIYSPPFDGADLRGASFKNAELRGADFRDAIGILEVDFTGTRGLETCFFDAGDRERIVEKYGKQQPLPIVIPSPPLPKKQ